MVLALLGTAALAIGQAKVNTQRTGLKVQKEHENLVKLEKGYVSAKAAYTKASKDPKKKKAYADAATEFGYAVMVTQTLPPREKYPKALKLFRETLKVEPKHAKALKWSKTIEDIYKSMGRPVPKG